MDLENIKNHLRGNTIMYGTAIALATLLGGSFVIEMPADRKVRELRSEIAQNWQQRQIWEQQQQLYHRNKELEQIRWRMDYITKEINRINAIPAYLNRPLTPQEAWQIEQLKQEWNLLRQREQQLTR